MWKFPRTTGDRRCISYIVVVNDTVDVFAGGGYEYHFSIVLDINRIIIAKTIKVQFIFSVFDFIIHRLVRYWCRFDIIVLRRQCWFWARQIRQSKTAVKLAATGIEMCESTQTRSIWRHRPLPTENCWNPRVNSTSSRRESHAIIKHLVSDGNIVLQLKLCI